MATQAEITDYSNRIYNTAIKGTPTNPQGLPPFLALLLVSQAKHETGDFSSNAFVQDNNAFGYSYVPGAQWQAGAGIIADNGQPVAKYASLENSVGELIDWIYRRVKEGKFPANLNTITSPQQYAQLLKDAGYYGDTVQNYTAGLVRWLTDTARNVPAIAWLALALLIAYLVWPEKTFK